MKDSLLKYLKNCESELDNLQISISDCDGLEDGVIVHLTGYIDTYNSVVFLKQIDEVINNYRYIIFDFTGMTYLSSTGIGSFTEFLKKLNLKGGDMAIYSMADKIYEVFSLLGFSNFFKIKRSLEEAIEVINKVETKKDDYFPTVIKCPSCDNRLNAKKAGRFRCPKCKCIIGITEKAVVYLG